MTDDGQSAPYTSALSGALDQFESAWQSRELNDVRRQIMAPNISPAALKEMAMIDLEYRWQLAGESVVQDDALLPPRPRSEDYVEQFPMLANTPEGLRGIIANEYRVRHRFGDAPSIDPFVVRFPKVNDLESALKDLDAKMRKLWVRVLDSEATLATQRVPYEFLIGRQTVRQPAPICLCATSERYKLVVTPLENTKVSRDQLMFKFGGGSRIGVRNVSAQTAILVGSQRLAPGTTVDMELPIDFRIEDLQIQVSSQVE